MLFLDKTISNYFTGTPYDALPFKKPQTCPHCGINTDANKLQHFTQPYVPKSNDNLLLFIWRCSVCKKVFVSFHLIKDRKCSYLGIFPQKTVSYTDEYIEKISPRFIEIYNQALQAENIGCIELAAVGFRSALEILIKDYAINCLSENEEDVIKLNLNNTISKYLTETNLLNSADVVRILGNDHTHYKRKYPEHDFQLLKKYMDIFVQLICAKIMVIYPPVSR